MEPRGAEWRTARHGGAVKSHLLVGAPPFRLLAAVNRRPRRTVANISARTHHACVVDENDRQHQPSVPPDTVILGETPEEVRERARRLIEESRRIKADARRLREVAWRSRTDADNG